MPQRRPRRESLQPWVNSCPNSSNKRVHNYERTGLVSRAVAELIAKQVQDRSLVVWFDPERHYTDVAQSLALDRTTVIAFDGSFLQLRRKIAPWLGGEMP